MNAQPRPGSAGLLLISLALALLGVASLLLAPFELLVPAGMDPFRFKLLSLIQPAILAVISVLTGHLLADRMGLDAPLLRALVTRQSVKLAVVGPLKSGIIVGLAAGLIQAAYKLLTAGQTANSFDLPLATRLLYGGVTEEFIARWGLMSLGVWLALKATRCRGAPRPFHYWAGNCLAAVLFAVGHLSALFAAAPAASPGLVLAAVAANFLPALAFGWLFLNRGLESAIMAHATAHVCSSIYLGIL